MSWPLDDDPRPSSQRSRTGNHVANIDRALTSLCFLLRQPRCSPNRPDHPVVGLDGERTVTKPDTEPEQLIGKAAGTRRSPPSRGWDADQATERWRYLCHRPDRERKLETRWIRCKAADPHRARGTLMNGFTDRDAHT